MTLQRLNELCEKHNIPNDVKLLSDSGWECCDTEMDGVWYSKEINTIVFTQDYFNGNYEVARMSDLPKGTKFIRIE